MARHDWERVRAELANARQSRFLAGAFASVRNSPPTAETAVTPDTGRTQKDARDADAQKADATDALLDHIALALAQGMDQGPDPSP